MDSMFHFNSPNNQKPVKTHFSEKKTVNFGQKFDFVNVWNWLRLLEFLEKAKTTVGGLVVDAAKSFKNVDSLLQQLGISGFC